MTDKVLLYVVDDDDAVRESLQAVLESADYEVIAFGSATAFLDDHTPKSGCLITDIRMPAMDGLQLQEEVTKRAIPLPVIIMTGHGDIALAVRAMKAGAYDFIEKPFDDGVLLASVKRAIELFGDQLSQREAAQSAQRLISLLTNREREVLEKMVEGRPNKVAAYELGISPRTVEIHRANIMDKLNARSLSEVVRIWLSQPRPGLAT